MKNITVLRHLDGYLARTENGWTGYGKSQSEAIGDLVSCHPEEFNITLEYLQTGYQWAKQEGIEIIDPDGFRDGVGLYIPISQKEWERRRDECTIFPLK